MKFSIGEFTSGYSLIWCTLLTYKPGGFLYPPGDMWTGDISAPESEKWDPTNKVSGAASEVDVRRGADIPT
jgi:hypothetical protein